MRESDNESGSYLEEAARRLRTVLADLEWTEQSGAMLVELLQVYGIQFDDGFVINGDVGESVLSRDDACRLVAAVAPEPSGADWKWWSRRAVLSKRSEFAAELADEIMGHTASHPLVKRVPLWAPDRK